ncbi:hypothetical protein AFLA70_82g003371 [Aspergillus flavus AF70]|nr:hypothetical protein AFLA70_82g003371 [Aspergillus flavus AF70]
MRFNTIVALSALSTMAHAWGFNCADSQPTPDDIQAISAGQELLMADNTPSAAELMADTLGGDGENCQDNLGKCNNSLNKVTNQLHTCKKSISDINFLKKKYEEVAWKALRSMPYFNLDQRYYTVDGATYVVYVGVSLSTYGRPVHAPDLQTCVRICNKKSGCRAAHFRPYSKQCDTWTLVAPRPGFDMDGIAAVRAW